MISKSFRRILKNNVHIKTAKWKHKSNRHSQKNELYKTKCKQSNLQFKRQWTAKL